MDLGEFRLEISAVSGYLLVSWHSDIPTLL